MVEFGKTSVTREQQAVVALLPHSSRSSTVGVSGSVLLR